MPVYVHDKSSQKWNISAITLMQNFRKFWNLNVNTFPIDRHKYFVKCQQNIFCQPFSSMDGQKFFISIFVYLFYFCIFVIIKNFVNVLITWMGKNSLFPFFVYLSPRLYMRRCPRWWSWLHTPGSWPSFYSHWLSKRCTDSESLRIDSVMTVRKEKL